MGPMAVSRWARRSAVSDLLAVVAPSFITLLACASVFGCGVASMIACFSLSLKSSRRTFCGLAVASPVTV